jgi:hypothetical protein
MKGMMHTGAIAPRESNVPVVLDNSWLKTWGERALLVLLLALFVARGLVPAWRHVDPDFASYYLAARLTRQGYPAERIYEWGWFQRQKDHLGIEQPLVGLVPSTLTSILLIVPLTTLPPLPASRCWLAINLALLLAIAAVLRKITSLSWTWIGILMFLAVSPLRDNFLVGQVHVVMLFLLTVAAWLHFRNSHFASGIILGIAAALKVYTPLFALLFLVKRQWRAVTGLVLGIAGALLVSIKSFGAAASQVYFLEILPRGLRGETIDPYGTGWNSINALLRRLFVFEPELNPSPVAHLPHVYALLHSVIYVLIPFAFLGAIAAKGTNPARQKLEWAVYCLVILLLFPEMRPYNFVVLILIAAAVVDYLVTRGQWMWAGAVVSVYVLACVPYDRLNNGNPHGWTSLLYFPRLWFLFLLAGAFLWFLLSNSAESLVNFKSRALVPAAGLFAAITVMVYFSDLRHLAGQFDNYGSRLTTTIGSAIAADPVATRDSAFYQGLVPQFKSAHDAYYVQRLKEGSIASFGGDGDWFHPAATIDGQRAWAEIASAGGSRVVRFQPSGSNLANPMPDGDVSDAERPAVSLDGEWLAFIRDVRGRGGLWIVRTGTPGIGPRPSERSDERPLAGPEYDVGEAAFSPDGQVSFSSWQGGRYRLYSVGIQTGAPVEMTLVPCSVRYPAFSPDGTRIAFSCERSGAWQLVTMNRKTGELLQLTNADCNSITPAWSADSKSLIYATDCGRAVGITALSKLDVKP